MLVIDYVDFEIIVYGLIVIVNIIVGILVEFLNGLFCLIVGSG